MLRSKLYAVAGMVSALFLAGLPASTVAQDIRKVEPSKLTTSPVPSLPGVENVFVLGSFTTPGLYAAQGVMRRGAVFPPHSHPDTRISVVVSGTMYLGQGDRVDETSIVAYPTGTMAVTPANVPHFMLARDGDVTIMEIGSGPSGATFFKE